MSDAPSATPEGGMAGASPNGEARHLSLPVSRGAALHDPVSLIRGFNARHPERERLYRAANRAADDAEHARRARAEAQAEADGAEIAYQTARAWDPSRHAPRWRQYLVVVLTVLLEAGACYLAAQALGGDQAGTLIVTGLLLAGLVAGEFALDAMSHGDGPAWRRIALALAAFVVVLGLLRFRYVWTLSGSLLQALLFTAVFTATTAGFVAIGYWALRVAETAEMAQGRRQRRRARRALERATQAARGTARVRDQRISAYLAEVRPSLLDEGATQDEVRGRETAIRGHLTETTIRSHDEAPR